MYSRRVAVGTPLSESSGVPKRAFSNSAISSGFMRWASLENFTTRGGGLEPSGGVMSPSGEPAPFSRRSALRLPQTVLPSGFQVTPELHPAREPHRDFPGDREECAPRRRLCFRQRSRLTYS